MYDYHQRPQTREYDENYNKIKWKKTVKLLIILPTWGQEEFIGDCIKSLLCQTGRDFFCIIVNDHSPDKTQDIIDGLVDERFLTITPPIELGAAGTQVNYGLDYADKNGITAEYECRIDGDNCPCPDFAEVMVSEMINRPDIDFVYSDYNYINMVKKDGWVGSVHNRCQKEVSWDMLQGGNSMGPSLVWKSSFRKRVNGVTDGWHDDWRWVVKCFILGAKFYYLDKNLYNYRNHEKNISHRNSGLALKYNDDVRREATALRNWTLNPSARPTEDVLKMWRWPVGKI